MVFPRVVSSGLFYSCFIYTSPLGDILRHQSSCLSFECPWYASHLWIILCWTGKLAVEDYVRDIDAWMTENKLKINRDKTEQVVLNASHRQPSPLTSISVCDEVISKSSVATILVTNLQTLVCVSPSPMLIWVLQSSQCSKIHVVQHWGRRWALLSENKCVKSECKKFKRKFKANGFCFNDLWRVL